MIPAWLTGLGPVASAAWAILVRAAPLALLFVFGVYVGADREHTKALDRERELRAEMYEVAEEHAQKASEVAYQLGVDTTMAAARRAVATAQRDARVETIIKEVPRVRVQCPKDEAGSPDPDRGRLSGDWRVLHDAGVAAANLSPAPDAGHRPGDPQAAAPVDPAAALDTVLRNYRRAGENADTLTACQQSMRAVIAACWATTLTAAQEGDEHVQEPEEIRPASE